MKNDWGPKYDYNLSKVQQATDYLGITEEINELGLGSSSMFLKTVLDKIVPAISNDKLVESAQQDTLAATEDSLNEVEGWLMKYEGSTRDPEYLAKVKERTALLTRTSF